MAARVKEFIPEQKLSTAHQQMIDDGCPRFLLRTGGMIACNETFERLRTQAAREPTIRRITNPRDIVQGAPAAILGTPEAPKKPLKYQLVGQMLLRKEGCTAAEVMKAMNWTKIAMNDMAERNGLTLRKVKEGTVTRYFGSK